ncbi:hypothetical protein J3R82DRAFT_4378 [Butyriboletus roseoflavus]|nr:hypothetical protein J3R82DRAFT_4378 [Butyriboletus roseoflavus]
MAPGHCQSRDIRAAIACRLPYYIFVHPYHVFILWSVSYLLVVKPTRRLTALIV